MDKKMQPMDGGEAAARIAYRVSEVCAIYPITPSSTMAELSDQWCAEGLKNLWGNKPLIAEMESEGGAAGAVHGALQTGALATTFTASQGLMLMLPNMLKIAGELTPAVFHIAARTVAGHALSIFGDHSDVMFARSTGFAMLAGTSVQEVQDMALVSHASTLEARIPFMHFFDGFRTSHEINKTELISDDIIREMIDDKLVQAQHERGLNPNRPVLRGTAQNPDVFFQSKEGCNSYYAAVPGIVQKNMDKLAKLTGRQYHLFDYYGAEDAEHVTIMIGSSCKTTREVIAAENAKGAKLGLIEVHLYRPFSAEHFIDALPKTVKKIAVLDRCKDVSASGEPLYQDVNTVLSEAFARGLRDSMPLVIGGRYGLSSKDFTPAMAKAVYDELDKESPKNSFSVGINDDVTHKSLDVDPTYVLPHEGTASAIFFGFGSDGTVGASKNTIKILSNEPDLYAQGYFVYDSRKSGTGTESHLRFGRNPINAPYLVQKANFIGVSQFVFFSKLEMVERAADGATVLINSHYSVDEVWDQLPKEAQQFIIDHKLKLYTIDAYDVAGKAGMGRRINTVMQTCYFALANILPQDVAIEKIKASIKKTYMRKGEAIVKKNFQAVDMALEGLHEVNIPAVNTSEQTKPAIVPDFAPQFVKDVTGQILAGKGDLIPVSQLPADGTYPTGTTRWEKVNAAQAIPNWDPELCVQCGNCTVVCPHAVVRAKEFDKGELNNAPEGFKSAKSASFGFPDNVFTLQFYAEDCTGCGLCATACPATDMNDESRKALMMAPKPKDLTHAREVVDFFEELPWPDRNNVDFSTVKGAQFLQPTFEFGSSCPGCGETPYLTLVSRLFGDRMLIANATGCSSIYGANLPTTPWSKNTEGRGPAWANSLFEDNAEFGFGYSLTQKKHREMAVNLLESMKEELGEDKVEAVLNAEQQDEIGINAQRDRVAAVRTQLEAMGTDDANNLLSVLDHLVKRSVWIIGGDGWAYDIGYGGLDHVIASGANVNILVLDTEVYSNTGGQASKSTPIGAMAKFAMAGKRTGKKDLALLAMSYGNVYVARVALGANPQQTLDALREAEAYDGPSIVIAYSHCIAHGINMEEGLQQQHNAVKSGHWPLLRYNPIRDEAGEQPLVLDSVEPNLAYSNYACNENRYKALRRANPELADQLQTVAQKQNHRKWNLYKAMQSLPSSNID
ncbi:Pyruvate-flavodoxin oxidoreductase [invertebrate metagenome]|uniref:Pyruvate-flavodoxin oxidoreductase n=1 Tax=invertebrate metagenome TaxID=1711999 RepID=A0A2H9T620_9ZZZZ